MTRWTRRLACLAVTLALPVALPFVPVNGTPVEAAPACATRPTAQVSQRPWAQRRLDYERVWPITTGAGVRVAVVDTGVDGRHPQLAGRVERGYDVRTGRHDGDHDCHGHGTFVAGLIAAAPRSGVTFAGVAPGVTIVPIRESDTDRVDVHDLAAGVRAAVNQHAKVINISTTTPVDDPDLRQAVTDAVNAGVVVVAAAGNEADHGDSAQYPATYPGVLSVGAITAAGARASFSETVGVDVVAPGKDLVSAGAGGTGLIGGDGTSYAAPFVAGVAALILAYRPGLTPAQVAYRIEATADHPAGPLPDRELGWGVVNPYAAVTTILPEEAGGPVALPSASPVALAARPVAHHDERGRLATGAALAAVVLVVIGLVAGGLLPRARRRGWRPAGTARVGGSVPAATPADGSVPATIPTGGRR